MLAYELTNTQKQQETRKEQKGLFKISIIFFSKKNHTFMSMQDRLSKKFLTQYFLREIDLFAL